MQSSIEDACVADAMSRRDVQGTRGPREKVTDERAYPSP